MRTRTRRLHNLPPIIGIAILGGLAIFYGSPAQPNVVANGQVSLRLGYFPNITHAPAVVGVARGEFQRAAGNSIVIDTKLFNDGPSAMEALLAGELDVSYVGPGPAINTFLKSQGRALKILAGACAGGASLVARAGAQIGTLRDLAGKRVAVPQLGGTQDIALRHFMAQKGLLPREKGGTVEIVPIKNPDILALFKQGQLDAAWVPEPWAERLIKEANAHIVVDERDLWPNRKFLTTVLVARRDYLEHHPAQVQAILEAHLRTIAWLRANPDEAQSLINSELKRLTGKALPKDVLQNAWARVEFSADPERSSLEGMVQAATEAGYLPPNGVDVAGLLDTRFLENAQRSVFASAR